MVLRLALTFKELFSPGLKISLALNNAPWRKICDKEMDEVDENEDDGVSDEEEIEDDVVIVKEDGRVHPKKKSTGKQRPTVQRSTDTAKRGFLKLLIRFRRVILQDAAVYLNFKKENNYVHTKRSNNSVNPFLSPLFKLLQEDILAALNNPTIGRLQEYENLVPNIVDSQQEVATRLTEVNHQLVRGQQQNSDRYSRLENPLNQQIEGNPRLESILSGFSYQLQQITRNQQILITNQQCLDSQIQLMSASNKLSTVDFNNSLPQAPIPMPPVPVPVPVQSPILIRPVSSSTISNSRTGSDVSNTKRRKKTKWVTYNPQTEN